MTFVFHHAVTLPFAIKVPYTVGNKRNLTGQQFTLLGQFVTQKIFLWKI